MKRQFHYFYNKNDLFINAHPRQSQRSNISTKFSHPVTQSNLPRRKIRKKFSLSRPMKYPIVKNFVSKTMRLLSLPKNPPAANNDAKNKPVVQAAGERKRERQTDRAKSARINSALHPYLTAVTEEPLSGKRPSVTPPTLLPPSRMGI